jgi:membrane-associated phospholipid phosphatase
MRSGTRSPLLAAGLCCVAFGAALVLAYVVGPAGRLDAQALHGLISVDRPAFHPVGNAIARSAGALPIAAVLALLFAWGWKLGRRREAIAAVAMVAAANLSAVLLQILLAHPRIYPVLGSNQDGVEAFPSGHATGAMSIALAAVLVAPYRARGAVAAAAVVYVSAVCISILVLSWHLPSDVVAGLLVAAAFFFLAVAAIRSRAERPTRPRARRQGAALWPVLGGLALVLLAGLVALVSASDGLLSFARLNTAATVTGFAIMAVSAALVASAASLSDR